VPGERLLLLGGTGDARALAKALVGKGYTVVSSLAGVTRAPLLPVGEVRVGGFGGAKGLAAYVRAEEIALVCDATHPFAVKISRNAAEGARAAGVPYVRYERPAWQPGADDQWTEVSDLEAAAAMIAPGARVFLTTGRKELDAFAARTDIAVVARMIETAVHGAPETWRIVEGRPPFPRDSEMRLMRDEAIDVLVTKNAGGAREKLDAAAALGIPVVMVHRPPKPDAPVASTVPEMLALIEAALAG
jgi:precorrin-6A/cobalt-precorrin-6A reductase